MILAYKLLTAKDDPEIDAILDQVILVLWPTLNPDGQDMVVHWYRQNLGTKYEVAPLPWLYQEYVGHDNNRDGYMMNMKEEQVVTKAELEYSPVIFYCQHQTAPFPARIWIPPFSDPISSNISPYVRSWLNVTGTNMSAYLDAHNLPGAISESRFDNWYAGFTDWAGVFRNEISFFTETALYRYATPRFYTADEFPKNEQDLRALTMYTTPWEGGWWHLKDAVDYMVAGSMSVLDLAAKNRETLLYNRYQAARDNIQHFRKEPPFAYVISDKQADTPEAGLLAQKMIDNGLDVYATKAGFKANGVSYPAGSWVIPMDQPYSALAKELFERQRYPDALENGTSKAIDLPYDVTGWTLSLQMGVDVDAVTDPLEADQRALLAKVDAATLPDAAVEGTGATVALSHKVNASFPDCECGARARRHGRGGAGRGEDRGGNRDRRIPGERFEPHCDGWPGEEVCRCGDGHGCARAYDCAEESPHWTLSAVGPRPSTKAGHDGFWRTTALSRRAFTTRTFVPRT